MAYVWYLKKCINSSYITFYAPQKPNDFLATSALNASDVANCYKAKHHIKEGGGANPTIKFNVREGVQCEFVDKRLSLAIQRIQNSYDFSDRFQKWQLVQILSFVGWVKNSLYRSDNPD